MHKALFEGLVIDENDHPVAITYVGDEPMYVINDAGFKRHIPAEQVDQQVLDIIKEQISGNEGLISEQTAKMLGQEDIFTKAAIENQISNLDKQFDQLMQMGIPEEGRAYMGMMGFKVVIDFHGEVLRLDQPAATDEGDE